MNIPALTARQTQILSFIRKYLAANHMPPTQLAIMMAMGFRSRTAVRDHLKALEKKGAISLMSGASRGIQLLERVPRAAIPLIGQVAAGHPILALENIQSHHSLDAGLFHPRADYLLKVQGMSMRDAGIIDGDLLAVHQTPEARNGQIVVARIDDEVTVKRFERKGHWVELIPANTDFKSLRIDLRKLNLSIEGLMVGLIRPTSQL
jgi:repressor LexA